MEKRVFKIVKRIEAKNIKDALKREKESEIVEIYNDLRENISINKKLGFTDNE